MKPYLLFILLFSASTTNAQRIRFTDHTNKWVTYGIGYNTPLSHNCGYGRDTILSGRTYRSVMDTLTVFDPSYPYPSYDTNKYFVREDTTDRMVYYRAPFLDTFEHVLYNYNLNDGDSIIYMFGNADSVTRIDSIIIDGLQYKVLYMQSKTSSGIPKNYVVVEGIGSTTNPTFPITGSNFEYVEDLICFRENNIAPLLTFPYGYDSVPHIDTLINCSVSVESLYLAVPTSSNPGSRISVEPNPATDYVDINSTKGFDDHTIIFVHDLNGKCIYQKQIASHTQTVTINTSSWPNGLYIFISQDKNGLLSREKITIIR